MGTSCSESEISPSERSTVIDCAFDCVGLFLGLTETQSKRSLCRGQLSLRFDLGTSTFPLKGCLFPSICLAASQRQGRAADLASASLTAFKLRALVLCSTSAL